MQSAERSLEFKPEDVMVRRRGKMLDLGKYDRAFLYKGWPKGASTNVPPREYIELQSGPKSITFRLDKTKPTVSVELLK